MTDKVREYLFESRDEASAAVAERIAALCTNSIESEGDARVVVSGGSTPARCFELLSSMNVDWQHVEVMLSDERWVAADDESSNERLVREKLLVANASAARLLPLFQADETIDQRAESLQALRPDRGFSCALLGMGTDGHFASLFPGAATLAEGLDPQSDRFYLPVMTAASPHPRLSMTLSTLLNSHEIQLLIFGDDKLAVYGDALSTDSDLPIAHLLRQTRTPVSVYWSP